MCVLCIETTGDVCSVALFEQSVLIHEIVQEKERTHSKILPLLIKQVFRESNYSKGYLKAVAVSQGPGSYTGLRVGVSVAKGLAYGLDIPVMGIDTLEIIREAHLSADGFDGDLLVAKYARKEELFLAQFDSKGNTMIPAQAKVVDKDLISRLQNGFKRISVVGDGAHLLKEVVPADSIFQDVRPRAGFMGRLSFRAFTEEKFENIVDFEPKYLKEYYFKKKGNGNS